MNSGTFLALDWGQKKIGYATADASGIVVTPRGILKRKVSSGQTWKLLDKDWSDLKKILEDFDICLIVLGLPYLNEEIEGAKVKEAKALGKVLEEKSNLKVEFINENLSSWENRGKENEDAHAAATLLEDYFSQRARKKRGRVFPLILVALGVLAVLSGYLLQRYYRFAFQDASQKAEIFMMDVLPGDSVRSVIAKLKDKDLVKDPLAWKIWIRLRNADKKLKTGEFELATSMSQRQILKTLFFGSPYRYQATFQEGSNIWDMENVLKKKFPSFNKEEYWKLVKNTQLLQAQELPYSSKAPTLEGYLFPETYSFEKYQKLDAFINNALSQFKKRALPILSKHPWAQEKNGIYKLLTLASVVEKESGNKEEQPQVASVFWNRIKKNMRLQSDPTTIYALFPNFDGNLRKIHLLTTTPYNTYKISGLPLGPICNPGETALRAVVNPDKTDYLFFVADGNGKHVFSKDYETHKKWVRKYQLGQ